MSKNTVYLEGPDGDLLVIHNADPRTVDRIIEEKGYREITAEEYTELADGREEPSEETGTWSAP